MFLEFYIAYCFIDAIFFLRKESSYYTLLRISMFIAFAAHVYHDAKFLEKGHFHPDAEICVPRPLYMNDWVDLSTRPVPDWYHNARIGIHVYWGVLSVPHEKQSFWESFLDGEWHALTQVRDHYGERFTYAKLAPQFKAELFEPDEWMTLFRDAGARYVLVTAKAEDGFALYPSKHSFSWNSVETGPKRDLLDLLSKSALKTGLRFGVSYSLHQWPLALENEYGQVVDNHSTTIWSDIKQLVNDYKVSILRFEGDWEAQEFYKGSPEYMAWVYNESPVRHEVVVTDVWDTLPPCHENLLLYDKNIQIYKKEEEITLDNLAKFYRRATRPDDVPLMEEIIKSIIHYVTFGYNILIAVPARPDGKISLIVQERLILLGEWLKINGEAIYGTYPWVVPSDGYYEAVSYVSDRPVHAFGQKVVYGIVTEWPHENLLTLVDVSFLVDMDAFSIELLGHDGQLSWYRHEEFLYISLPNKAKVKSKYAWVIKFYQKK